nr:response regulator transcription factor [Actinomycetales bacterium]
MTEGGQASSTIRVLLADDETLLRDALSALLTLQDGLEVVATAANGDEAVAAIAKWQPDVAVLDLQMPGRDGIGVVEAVIAAGGATRCIIVTSHGRPGYLRKALATGARAFLPKTTSARLLADVIRQVHAGQRYVDPELSAEAIAAGDSPLTPREADVLELAAGGAAIDEIAQRASLSPGTVRNYLSSASAKLGAANRHEAVEAARLRGWI